MKKQIFDATGLFDERFPLCEDYDLWLRVTSQYPVGLDEHEGTIKYGGHADQLSRSCPAMDLWRIRAMEKHIESRQLSWEDRRALIDELMRKLKIYINGARKRYRDARREIQLLERLRELQK